MLHSQSTANRFSIQHSVCQKYSIATDVGRVCVCDYAVSDERPDDNILFPLILVDAVSVSVVHRLYLSSRYLCPSAQLVPPLFSQCLLHRSSATLSQTQTIVIPIMGHSLIFGVRIGVDTKYTSSWCALRVCCAHTFQFQFTAIFQPKMTAMNSA